MVDRLAMFWMVPVTARVPSTVTIVLMTLTLANVCVGASQATAPVTAACVVVATAVVATLMDRVCVGASQTTTPVTAACVVVMTGPLILTVPLMTVVPAPADTV